MFGTSLPSLNKTKYMNNSLVSLPLGVPRFDKLELKNTFAHVRVLLKLPNRPLFLLYIHDTLKSVA